MLSLRSTLSHQSGILRGEYFRYKILQFRKSNIITKLEKNFIDLEIQFQANHSISHIFLAVSFVRSRDELNSWQKVNTVYHYRTASDVGKTCQRKNFVTKKSIKRSIDRY